MSKKLLIIFPSTQRGGAEEYTLTIAEAALQEGWKIHAAFPNTAGTISLIDDFTRQNIQYHQLDIGEVEGNKLISLTASLSRLFKTYRLISKLNPDVILLNLPAHHLAFTTLWLCGFLRIPTAVVFHLIPFSSSFSKNKLQAYHWAKTRNQQWITISNYNRKYLAEEFALNPQEFQCIYNGIKQTSPIIKNRKRSRYQIGQELGLTTNSKLLLTVARLHPQKGHDYLIPIIPTIINKFPEVQFVWVGDGDRQKYLTELLKEYRVAEKVTFLGYRADIPNLLAAADLFVFPSYQEGLPFAVLEAMVHGLPIVASDTGGIPEMIVNEQHGLLFKTGDRQNLLDKLDWALTNPTMMTQMANAASQRVRQFSVTQMQRDTLAVLRKLRSKEQGGR
jgi:glycosyltransferase involved in cell wall biosynthesis